MSELKHVRDPVTGRCVACEAMNNAKGGGGGFLDTSYHPDAGLSTGAGLMVQQSQNRPVTPVVFDPSDPNYIRAIRRGSVSLVKGQGVYTHGAATASEPPMLTSRPSYQPQQQPQILLLDASSPTQQQPTYRFVQQPQQQLQRQQQPPPVGRNIVLWQQAGGRVEPQQQQVALATVATAAVRQQRQPQTVLVQPSPGVSNIHGANFYPGQVPGRGGGPGGSGGPGCRDGCRTCCLSCCACCVCCRRPGGGSGGAPSSGPKRPYWSYEDGDARGRCCKGCLIGLCILLVLLTILAAILAAVYSTEAVAQSSPMSRRFLLVYNDTLCQQQARASGTTLSGCGYTKSAAVVDDSTFTNPTVVYKAGQRTAAADSAALAAIWVASAAAAASWLMQTGGI